MKLLLHICCGPCSLYPLTRLRKDGLEPVGYFFNPNIHPYMEFERRVNVLMEVSRRLDFSIRWQADYGLDEWMDVIGTARLPVDRCPRCYRMRLEATAREAVAGGFDAFSSTLLYSRYQQHDKIHGVGEELAARFKVNFFYEDFRKGWVEGIEMAKALGIYRQPYCGCMFSERERYLKRANRLGDLLRSADCP